MSTPTGSPNAAALTRDASRHRARDDSPPGAPAAAKQDAAALISRFQAVRNTTTGLCRHLEAEDYVGQSMPDASPAKWHLAHTSWFFEEFILQRAIGGYRFYDERFRYLFNSYYNMVGPMHARPQRGLLTRPTVREVLNYRAHVDERMSRLLARADRQAHLAALALGLNHEQQHQELLLTDIKHLFSCNPLLPACMPDKARTRLGAPPLAYRALEGGLADIGHPDGGFCFDNELPRHRTWIEPFQLANRPVTNAEFAEFVRCDGYRKPALWLSDGWVAVQSGQWQRPLYWSESLDHEFTLAGLRDIDPEAPVCHVSYYEADAFARWAQARLPSEQEWECAAATLSPTGAAAGNFLEAGNLHPVPAGTQSVSGPASAVAGQDDSHPPTLVQMLGDVWEWTRSPYVPYPGFRPLEGALGEYNGKFMVNQLVLRGGSCATPASHIRTTYRNFFPPAARWQFSGLRLARDG